MKKTQMTIRLSQQWYDSLPGILDKIRADLGIPGLTTTDIVVMGIQILTEWAAQACADRPGVLGGIKPPQPQESEKRNKPGAGRKRKPKE